MKFEFTSDYAAVAEILRIPECYCRMADDSAPGPEALPVGPGPLYVLAEDCGVFLLCPTIAGYADVHLCIRPAAWGLARMIGREFLAWAWRNTSLIELRAVVPEYNRLVLRLARAVGFAGDETGGTVVKHGREYRRLVLSLRRCTA